jgi:DNA-binding transcriptional MerR regulator
MNAVLETLLPEQVYFSISEVSEITHVKPYVIRYWETQFTTLKPSRRDSGQRKFTQKDVDTISKIKDLLYEKGLTISGARRYLKNQTKQGIAQLKLDLGEPSSASKTLDSLRTIRKDLEEALRVLRS